MKFSIELHGPVLCAGVKSSNLDLFPLINLHSSMLVLNVAVDNCRQSSSGQKFSVCVYVEYITHTSIWASRYFDTMARQSQRQKISQKNHKTLCASALLTSWVALSLRLDSRRVSNGEQHPDVPSSGSLKATLCSDNVSIQTRNDTRGQKQMQSQHNTPYRSSKLAFLE